MKSPHVSTQAAPVSTDPLDARAFRTALGMFATGVTVVATRAADGKAVGLTCNSFNSVSLAPPLVLWSLSLRSPNLPHFLRADHFSVNVLGAPQRDIAARFAQSIQDKFDGIAWHEGLQGLPLLDDVVAQFECRTEARHYSGDHVIFIGHVLRFMTTGGLPLVFHGGQYGTVTNHESPALIGGHDNPRKETP